MKTAIRSASSESRRASPRGLEAQTTATKAAAPRPRRRRSARAAATPTPSGRSPRGAVARIETEPERAERRRPSAGTPRPPRPRRRRRRRRRRIRRLSVTPRAGGRPRERPAPRAPSRSPFVLTTLASASTATASSKQGTTASPLPPRYRLRTAARPPRTVVRREDAPDRGLSRSCERASACRSASRARGCHAPAQAARRRGHRRIGRGLSVRHGRPARLPSGCPPALVGAALLPEQHECVCRADTSHPRFKGEVRAAPGCQRRRQRRWRPKTTKCPWSNRRRNGGKTTRRNPEAGSHLDKMSMLDRTSTS